MLCVRILRFPVLQTFNSYLVLRFKLVRHSHRSVKLRLSCAAMELGSNSAAVLADSAHSSSSNGCSLVNSFETMNSPSCNQALPAEISPELDEMEDNTCAQTFATGANASVHKILNQESTENGAAGRLSADTLQETRKEHEFAEREREDSEGGEIVEIFEPEGVEAEENVSRSITPAAKVLKKVRPAENLGVTRNAPASRRRSFFMVRMPRGADSQLRSKIKVAELQLEEAFKTRDVIRAALQLKRASKIGLLDKLKVVRDNERACKDAFQKKRLEIDPFQAALNKFKFADIKFKEDIFSEEDLDNKIARLQHRIQHESIPLKEEKQLIREIKQLESQRSQVCASDAEHAHLLESYGPKEDIQEQLDILYSQLDDLRAHQNQARLECEPIEKDLEDLNVKIDELVEQLEGAKRSQVAALTTCKELKKCLSEQNAEFYKNKDDVRKARELAASRILDELAALCNEQVESILRCWNNDSGFREKYIKNNEHSTLRRLETLDGRSLGPDEEPLLLMSDMDLTTETLPKSNEAGLKTDLQKVTEETPFSAGPRNKGKKLQAEEVKLQADKVLQGASGTTPEKEKITDSNKCEGKVAQNLESTKPPSAAVTTALVEDAAAKEAQAAELKEKRRREEIAKAKEAAERKRRQAERAQAKAQLRSQREAERREKEREKKARKKAAVGTEDLKPAEVPTIEGRESVVEDLPKDSVKGFSSQGRGPWVQPPKSRRHPLVSPISKRKMWQVPFLWLWVSLVILVIGLALVFVAKI